MGYANRSSRELVRLSSLIRRHDSGDMNKKAAALCGLPVGSSVATTLTTRICPRCSCSVSTRHRARSRASVSAPVVRSLTKSNAEEREARRRKLRGSAAPAERKRRHPYRRKAVGAKIQKSRSSPAMGMASIFCGKPQTAFCPHCVEMWCDIVETEIHATDQSAQGNRSTRQVVRLSSFTE